jgi:acetyl-CoA carboxylase biotin carboxylase subunit
VARGYKLSFNQHDLRINGHAIELRVCAEDPLNNFLPDTGKLDIYKPPKGPGVRVDDGYEEGMDIPIFYDSMLAKLVAYAGTRNEAIECLCRAIDEYYIKGIKTTLQFGKWAVQTEPFRSGHFDTKFIEKHYKPEYLLTEDAGAAAVAALLSATVWEKDKKHDNAAALDNGAMSKWKINRR